MVHIKKNRFRGHRVPTKVTNEISLLMCHEHFPLAAAAGSYWNTICVMSENRYHPIIYLAVLIREMRACYVCFRFHPESADHFFID